MTSSLSGGILDVGVDDLFLLQESGVCLFEGESVWSCEKREKVFLICRFEGKVSEERDKNVLIYYGIIESVES